LYEKYGKELWSRKLNKKLGKEIGNMTKARRKDCKRGVVREGK
jgi:hypothetical protein